MRRLIKGINRDYPDMATGLQQGLASLELSFTALEGTIRNTAHILSDDSPIIFELRQTLAKISRAADSVSNLAQSLDREPEALIRGRKNR